MSKYLYAQIRNSIELGWTAKDIILLATFDFEFMGVNAIKTELNIDSWTDSKSYGLKYLFNNEMVDDVIWVHDLDCWQNVVFECPDFKDIGIVDCGGGRYNGGCFFIKKSAQDIFFDVMDIVESTDKDIEEPAMNEVFRKDGYKERVTLLNDTYNVGCTGYEMRFSKADKPVKIFHFHPERRYQWLLQRQNLSERLRLLLRKEFYDQ